MSDSVRPHRWQPTRLPRPWDSPGKNTGVGCHFLLQCMKVKSESKVAQSASPWTAAYQAPPSMGFSRPEYWSGLPLPSPSEQHRRLKYEYKSMWDILFLIHPQVFCLFSRVSRQLPTLYVQCFDFCPCFFMKLTKQI